MYMQIKNILMIIFLILIILFESGKNSILHM